jgi:hypothetical protein
MIFALRVEAGSLSAMVDLNSSSFLRLLPYISRPSAGMRREDGLPLFLFQTCFDLLKRESAGLAKFVIPRGGYL